jgi:SAM-dependent methyltransferase
MVHQDEEELRQVYNDRYEKNHTHQVNQREIDLYKKYMSLFKLNLPVDFTHLDIGCGFGHKTIASGWKSKSTMGIDLSDYAVSVAQSLYPNHKNIKFSTQNILNSEEKFDLITSFGLSLQNEKNIEKYLDVTNNIITNNLQKQKGATMVIGSFTDFSGGNEESWYYHTKSDLEDILLGINKLSNISTRIIFPHKLKSNYLGHGVYNFMAEIYKRFKNKRQNYFIIIEHE